MNRNTLSTTRQLTDASTSGKFVFVPSFQANIPDTLAGYPIRVLVDMVDIASNALAVAFGDMQETYTVVDRVGLSLLVDPYTDKPNVRFYMRKRVGGDVVNFDSMKFLKFSA
jgi:HK97 family phage major capsid protein